MPRRPKLVFVTQNLAPFRLRWLEALSVYLDVVIFHLDIYDVSFNKKNLNEPSEKVKVNSNFSRLAGTRWFKIRNILLEKADILMLDGYGFFGQILLIFQLFIMRVPYYMSIDGGYIPEQESFCKYFLKRFCMLSAKGFFSTSNETDAYISHYRKQPRLFRHFFSSIMLEDIKKISKVEKTTLREKLGLDNRFVIVTVGRFLPIKGFDILLETAKLTSNSFTYIFIGGEPSVEYKRYLKELDENSVRFIDYLSKNELVNYYLAGDVFVFPTRGDVWGLVIGEAMACGLPIISSTKSLAALDMVQDGINGFLIPDEDPQKYHQSILRLSEDTELREKISKNNYNLIQKYAIDESVKNDLRSFRVILSDTNNE